MSRFRSRPGTATEHANFVVEDTAYNHIVIYVASHRASLSAADAERLNHLDAIRPGLSPSEVLALDYVVQDWQPGRYLESA